MYVRTYVRMHVYDRIVSIKFQTWSSILCHLFFLQNWSDRIFIIPENTIFTSTLSSCTGGITLHMEDFKCVMHVQYHLVLVHIRLQVINRLQHLKWKQLFDSVSINNTESLTQGVEDETSMNANEIQTMKTDFISVLQFKNKPYFRVKFFFFINT